jgi:hypothetical protein
MVYASLACTSVVMMSPLESFADKKESSFYSTIKTRAIMTSLWVQQNITKSVVCRRWRSTCRWDYIIKTRLLSMKITLAFFVHIYACNLLSIQRTQRTPLQSSVAEQGRYIRSQGTKLCNFARLVQFRHELADWIMFFKVSYAREYSSNMW